MIIKVAGGSLNQKYNLGIDSKAKLRFKNSPEVYSFICEKKGLILKTKFSLILLFNSHLLLSC